jgi:CRISPR-associated endonuclease Csy4
MKYYQELTLIPNAEISSYFIWSKLYTQLHLGLVEIQNQQGAVPVGVSFPEFMQKGKKNLLGNKLRIFAVEQSTLESLDLPKWLARLADYINCSDTRLVPERVSSYSTYQRYHPKTNMARLARRYAKRNNISYEEALSNYSNFKEKQCDLPFIRLKSLTNSNYFELFIKKNMVEELINKGFNTYGLSSISSVPEF